MRGGGAHYFWLYKTPNAPLMLLVKCDFCLFFQTIMHHIVYFYKEGRSFLRQNKGNKLFFIFYLMVMRHFFLCVLILLYFAFIFFILCALMFNYAPILFDKSSCALAWNINWIIINVNCLRWYLFLYLSLIEIIWIM